jgi:ribosomal protein S8
LYRITAEFEKINDSLLRSEKQFEVAESKANESVLSMLEENKFIADIHKKTIQSRLWIVGKLVVLARPSLFSRLVAAQ